MSKKDSTYYWEKKLPSVEDDLNDIFLYFRPYSFDIEEFSVYYNIANEKKTYYKTFFIENDGYQIPIDEQLKSWKVLKTSDTLTEKNLIDGNKVIFQIKPKKGSRAAKFVLANLSILVKNTRKKVVENSFFETRKKSFDKSPLLLKEEFYSHHIKQGTIEETDRAQRSNIFLENVESLDIEMQIFKNTLNTAIDLYPFYEIKNLDKNRIKTKMSLLINKYNGVSDYCDLIKDSKRFIKEEFNDGHFGIRNLPKACSITSKERTLRPFRLYIIENKVFVALVSDERYTKILAPGTEIIEINGDKVKTILDTLFLKGLYDGKTPQEFTHGIIKKPGDSVLLKVKSDSIHQKIVKVDYNRKHIIPLKRNIRNCAFRKENEDIAYFTVTNWTLDVYLKLLNHWEEIVNSEKLIIDLRGNGGGTLLTVMRTLSIFIHDDSPVYSFQNHHDINNQLILSPNREKHIPDHVETVILIDKNTACSSEVFLNAMKHFRKNTTIIGKEKTRGIIANRFDIHFPSGFSLYVNSMTKKILLPPSFRNLETIGVYPDVLVPINEIKDLRLYEDAVFKHAVKL